MANAMFGFPNYADSTFNNVVLSGGDWASGDGSLANILDPRLDKAALSDGVTLADTQFQIDLGSVRDVRLIAIPSHNLGLNSRWRMRGTLTALWTGCKVGATGSVSDTTIEIKNASSSSVTITAGDVFTIAGFSYESDGTVVIASAATETITFSTTPSNDTLSVTLQTSVALDDAIQCNMGDFSATQFDSGWQDSFQVVYPYGTKPWGNPSAWTGKINEEERTKYKHPLVETFVTKIARFWLIELDDTSNAESGVRLSRFFIAPAWQPSLNPVYGANFSFNNETVVEKSVDGVESFERKQPFRTLGFTISLLTEDEALASAAELQRDAGSDKQIFFVFDPDDTLHLSRRSFTARMQSINPLVYSNYSRMDFAGELREIQGGLLT